MVWLMKVSLVSQVLKTPLLTINTDSFFFIYKSHEKIMSVMLLSAFCKRKTLVSRSPTDMAVNTDPPHKTPTQF